jgi:hypothetical protein
VNRTPAVLLRERGVVTAVAKLVGAEGSVAEVLVVVAPSKLTFARAQGAEPAAPVSSSAGSIWRREDD